MNVRRYTLAAVLLAALVAVFALPSRLSATDPTPTPTPSACQFRCAEQTTTPFPFHFAGLPELYVVGLPITLSVEASPPAGATLAYRWDWGDGTPPDSGAQATHIYSAPGSYTLIVSAIATPGGAATISTMLNVQPRQPPTVVTLPPDGQQMLTTAAHCPGLFWLEGEGFTTASCGCCAPRPFTLTNDGDQTLTVAYDPVVNTMMISAPKDYAVVATDFNGCMPTNDDGSDVRCPAPNSYPPGEGPALHLGSVASGTFPMTVSYPTGWNLIGGVHVPAGAGTVGFVAQSLFVKEE